MDFIIVLLSFTFVGCVVALILYTLSYLVRKVRKTPTEKQKKKIIVSGVGIVASFVLIMVAVPTSQSDSNGDSGDGSAGESNPVDYLMVNASDVLDVQNIGEYDFGEEIINALNGIGATNITNIICDVSNLSTITFKVETDGPSLWLSLGKSYSDDGWYVKWVKDYDNHNFYFCNESDKFTESGLLKESIYSFETGVVVEQVDQKAIDAYYKEIEENSEREAEERKQQERYTAAALFHEIRAAYKNNELSADDTYKGNRYTVIGEFDGVSEDGLFNKILDEINVTVKIMDGETTCYVFCSFDAETWREKLAALNKGDEMIIDGECYSWGNWNDCKLK